MSDGSRLDSNNASIRVLHASPKAPNIDVYFNNNRVIENLAYSKLSSYLRINPGSNNIKVYPGGRKDKPVIDMDVNITQPSRFTAAAIGTFPYISLYPISDPMDEQMTTKSCVRFIHLSQNAPAVDITLSGGTRIFDDIGYKQVTDYITLTPGIYNFQVRVFGSNKVILTIPNVELSKNKCYSIYAVGLLKGNPPLSAITVEDSGENQRNFKFNGYQNFSYDNTFFRKEYSRAIEDVERVVSSFEYESDDLYSGLQRYGINKEITTLFVKTIVSYIDENYDRYKGTIEEQTKYAVRDLQFSARRIFNIMREFNVPQERIINIVSTITKFAFENLRPRPIYA